MGKKQGSNPAAIRVTVTDGQVRVFSAAEYEVRFLGADFPQVVGDDLTVRQPLTDTTVRLSFTGAHRQTGEKFETDVPLAVPGRFGAQQGAKPPVVPEVAQWHAGEGKPVRLAELKSVACTPEARDAAALFAQDLAGYLGRELPVTVCAERPAGAVWFQLDDVLSRLGAEGYTAAADGEGICLCAPAENGLIWAGKTALQLLAQGGFPCGQMEDYPRYPVRGYMLDVGRRPCSLATLRRIVAFMAWFKMNDFQIHLSDNYIWLEDYAQRGDDSTMEAYEAFRLESSLANENGETPTAKDYAYSRDEFREFIAWAKKRGVRIVPEIDVPAHALSFAKVFPEHMVRDRTSPLMKKRPLTDHLDVSRPETVDFIKRIFDDYTRGEDPVFPPDVTVHIGADEFLSDYGAYRRFLNEIIPYIRQTNPVRLWGGLTWIKDEPATPIVPEAVEHVQMNLWSKDWADGREMYEMGYDLINTIDHYLYMVPNGSGRRGSYMDYLNKKKVFCEFEPGRVRLKEGGKYVDLPAGEKRVLGAAFALWNDNIDRRASGLTEGDLFDRFMDSAPLMAEKTWGSCTERHSAGAVDRAARAAAAPLERKTGLSFTLDPVHCECCGGARPGDALKLAGGKSFVPTGLTCAPVGAELELDILFREVGKNQILLEADAPYGTYDIRLTESGKLGFTREGYTYEFDYIPPVGKQLHLRICTRPLRTVLRVGAFTRKKAVGKFVHNGVVRRADIKNATLALPCARIGSAENAVNAEIYRLALRG